MKKQMNPKEVIASYACIWQGAVADGRYESKFENPLI